MCGLSVSYISSSNVIDTADGVVTFVKIIHLKMIDISTLHIRYNSWRRHDAITLDYPHNIEATMKKADICTRYFHFVNNDFVLRLAKIQRWFICWLGSEMQSSELKLGPNFLTKICIIRLYDYPGAKEAILKNNHDYVIEWKHFPRYWPFVRGIHPSPVNSPHKGQWREALMFSLIWVWINGWINNGEAGELRRHRAHYDVSVIHWSVSSEWHKQTTWSC